MSTFEYQPSGVCARIMTFDVEDNKIKNLKVKGGCHGNLQGIARLVDGMDIDEVIQKVEGIYCGIKDTSCPDQLAKALKEYKAQTA